MTEKSDTDRDLQQHEHSEQGGWFLIALMATGVLSWCVYKATSNIYWAGAAASAVVAISSVAIAVAWSITGDFKVLAHKLQSR